MAILKLQNEGDSHTMTVTECKTVTGNYGEQVLFSDGTDALYLPKQSADRQLDRLGLDESSVVGMNLTFSRDANPKKGAKPYWGISYAGTEPAQPKPTARVVPQAVPAGDASPAQRRDKVLSQYLILWETVALHMQSVCDNKNITLDAQAIQAAAATVWISWKDKGIQPDGLDAKPVQKAPEVKMPAASGKRLAPPDFSKIPPPDDNDMDDSLPF